MPAAIMVLVVVVDMAAMKERTAVPKTFLLRKYLDWLANIILLWLVQFVWAASEGAFSFLAKTFKELPRDVFFVIVSDCLPENKGCR